MSARAAIPTGPRSRLWTPHGSERDEMLSIAMLAPPWIAVPPAGYGGIEAVIDVLCDELDESGHSVTLFAAPGSHSRATVVPVLAEPHPEAIGSALYEADHVARAFEKIERAATSGRPFDVVHDHSGFTALAMADRIPTPLVHTLHGPFTADIGAFYERHGSKAEIVAISQAQRRGAPPALRGMRVIPNPIAVDRCAFRAEKDDYLLWLGRMDECKGPHRAIDVARLARRRIVVAGPVQPGQEQFFDEEIEPRLVPGRSEYVGEVSGSPKQQLLARAAALLMPIRWAEPFGMVMIEALAAGTPVIAFPEGAATEIVIDGENGFLVSDEIEMAEATTRLHTIDPHRCRASVAGRYDGAVVARRYVAAYRAARDRAAHAAAVGRLD